MRIIIIKSKTFKAETWYCFKTNCKRFSFKLLKTHNVKSLTASLNSTLNFLRNAYKFNFQTNTFSYQFKSIQIFLSATEINRAEGKERKRDVYTVNIGREWDGDDFCVFILFSNNNEMINFSIRKYVYLFKKRWQATIRNSRHKDMIWSAARLLLAEYDFSSRWCLLPSDTSPCSRADSLRCRFWAASWLIDSN